jgi:hypothetical protein
LSLNLETLLDSDMNYRNSTLQSLGDQTLTNGSNRTYGLGCGIEVEFYPWILYSGSIIALIGTLTAIVVGVIFINLDLNPESVIVYPLLVSRIFSANFLFIGRLVLSSGYGMTKRNFYFQKGYIYDINQKYNMCQINLIIHVFLFSVFQDSSFLLVLLILTQRILAVRFAVWSSIHLNKRLSFAFVVLIFIVVTIISIPLLLERDNMTSVDNGEKCCFQNNVHTVSNFEKITSWCWIVLFAICFIVANILVLAIVQSLIYSKNKLRRNDRGVLQQEKTRSACVHLLMAILLHSTEGIRYFCAIKTKLGALNVTTFTVCSSDLTQLYELLLPLGETISIFLYIGNSKNLTTHLNQFGRR